VVVTVVRSVLPDALAVAAYLCLFITQARQAKEKDRSKGCRYIQQLHFISQLARLPAQTHNCPNCTSASCCTVRRDTLGSVQPDMLPFNKSQSILLNKNTKAQSQHLKYKTDVDVYLKLSQVKILANKEHNTINSL
jgi:hypothetical protein